MVHMDIYDSYMYMYMYMFLNDVHVHVHDIVFSEF